MGEKGGVEISGNHAVKEPPVADAGEWIGQRRFSQFGGGCCQIGAARGHSLLQTPTVSFKGLSSNAEHQVDHKNQQHRFQHPSPPALPPCGTDGKREFCRFAPLILIQAARDLEDVRTRAERGITHFTQSRLCEVRFQTIEPIAAAVAMRFAEGHGNETRWKYTLTVSCL